MSLSAAPPVAAVGTTLTLQGRDVDLATRALVVAVVPPPRWARESEVVAGVRAAAAGMVDVVEVPPEPRLLGPAARVAEVPVAARVTTPEAAAAAASAGAAVVLVPAEHVEVVAADDRAEAWQVVTLVGEARAARDAVREDPRRVVALDVTGRSGADAVSEESLALAVGARMIRSGDVRRTRRVVEVMARLLEARTVGRPEGARPHSERDHPTSGSEGARP
jgi:hypothetical protein